MPHDTVRLFSRVNRRMAIAFWSLLAVIAIAAVATSTDSARWAIVPVFAAAAYLVWVVLWRPHVTVSDDGIHVANPLVTVDIDWDAVIHVDTRYTATVHTPGRKVAIWAAPQPGALASARAQRRHRGLDAQALRLPPGTLPRVGDMPGTESGDAALAIRVRWEELREAGVIETGRADDVVPVVRPQLAALVGGPVAIVLGLTLAWLVTR